MPYPQVVCYYSSAAPQSGYSSAVRGYAQKLAGALGYEARQLASPAALPDEVPEITIGLEDAAWPDRRPLHELKARPYGDQHGGSVSMHALTHEQLARAAMPKSGRMGLVCVANPHWLMTDDDLWARWLKEWTECNRLHQVVLSNSPRTNPLMWQHFSEAALEWIEHATLNEVAGDNRYLEALASADAICILGSSRSMAGEAAMTGAPVAIVGDSIADENSFFADIQQNWLELRGVFGYFDPENPLPEGKTEPFDVTLRYVEAALQHIRAPL